MFFFALYVLTALALAVHLGYMLTLGTLTARIHVLEYVAAAGLAVTLLSAYLSLWRPKMSAQLALIGSLAAWAFYAPAIRSTLAQPAKIAFVSRAGVFAVVAVSFLALSTVLSVATMLGKPRTSEPIRHPTRAQLGFVLAITAAGLLVAAGSIFYLGRRQATTRLVFLLPPSYKGWVRIDFGVSGMPAFSAAHDGRISVPPSGVIQTSTTSAQGFTGEFRFETTLAPAKTSTALVVQRRTNAGAQQTSEYIWVGDVAPAADSTGADGMPIPGPVRQSH